MILIGNWTCLGQTSYFFRSKNNPPWVICWTIPRGGLKNRKNLARKKIVKLQKMELSSPKNFRRNWILKQPLLFTGCYPKYIFKIAPSINTFSKIILSKKINFVSLIYSSSESSEELSKSSTMCLTTFFQYIYLLLKKLGDNSFHLFWEQNPS